METMTESGVLPMPHNPHPYLSAPGNPSTASVIHPSFFPGSSRDKESMASPTAGAPNDDRQQNFTSTDFPRSAPMPAPQDYPPFPYKQQQFQQEPFSRDQGQNLRRPSDPYHPQQYPGDDAGSLNFTAYTNVQGGFDRIPDPSRTLGFPRTPNGPASSSPFPNFSQSPDFRAQQQHLLDTSAHYRGGPGPREIKKEESMDTRVGYSDQQAHGMFPHQQLFNQKFKEQCKNSKNDMDVNFASPNFYEKQQNRFAGYNTPYGGHKSFKDGVFPPEENIKSPHFPGSIKGFLPTTDNEAEPMAHDSIRLPSSDRSGFGVAESGLKSRESLERSVSQDVQPVAWGPHLDPMREERDADGRPLRSLTLDPTLHRRHARPEAFGHKEYSERGNVYPHITDRRSSLPQEEELGNDRISSYQKQEKDQGDGMMLSPAKPSRLVCDNGQSIRDAESAAIPQQSPNRPGPATFQPDRMSQAPMSNEADQTSPQPQSMPVWKASSPKPNPMSPMEKSPQFRSPAPGKNPSQAGGEGRHDCPKEDDGDDIDGDPKAGKSDNSLYRDDQPLASPQGTDGNENMNTTKSGTEVDDSPSMYENIRSHTRDSSLERNPNKGDGSGDDTASFTAKRELFSEDEDEEGSQGAGSRREHYPGGSSPRSMSPPSPDSSMTYPPHYPNPFFSTSRGMNPAMSFGTPRGGPHPDAGHGFPFSKDFPGPFPMPGMGGTPEMGMGALSRMGAQRGHSAHPRFMNPMGPMDDENKDIYFCHLCSYSGKTKPDFDAHMSIHFEFNCPHCDYTSRTEGRLKRHIKDFHSDDSSRRSMPGRPKIYRCKQCPFSAKEKDKFWAHARSHIKEDKLLQCPKCSFVTEYKHHLEYHLRNHFGSKPFKCTKCNYSCVNKSMLNSHMKSHTNVYQYRCAECTYATKYCHSLKLHLKKYGHKPATVLNQDGSLPQGLDIDASGLSVATKRGPPRGPRGPRREKSGGPGGSGGDPYLNQLFGMPPVPMGVPGMGPHAMNAINPMLNGMMPFWPMLPHGPGAMAGHPQSPHHASPSQPGMLPGIGSLAHQMRPGPGMMPPQRLDHESPHRDGYSNHLPISKGMNRGPGIGRSHSMNNDDRRNSVFDREEKGIDNLYVARRESSKQEYPACNLCDFVAENTRELYIHYVDVHKEEPGRVFGLISKNNDEEKVDFSFSEDGENEGRSRKVVEKGSFEMEKRRMSQPSFDTESENDHPNNDFHRRNTLAGLLPEKGNYNTNGNFERRLKASWQTSPAFPDREGSDRMGSRYPGVGKGLEDEDAGKSLSKEDRDTNILHQMTLKFGNDAPLERDGLSRDTSSSHSEVPDGIENEHNSVPSSRQPNKAEGKGIRAGRPHKETPLDLTKPKPDSPYNFDNSLSPTEDGEEHSFTRGFPHSSGLEGKEKSDKSLSKVTESLSKKRPYPEDLQEGDNKSSENSCNEKASAIMPRKRSRKGKAYKLDTICLKLQEQNSSPLDSDGNESDMEMGFSSFQPLIPTVNSSENQKEVDKEEVQKLDQIPANEMKDVDVKDKDVTSTVTGMPGSAENDGMDSDGTEDYTNDERKDDFDDFKKVGEMTKLISKEEKERPEQKTFSESPIGEHEDAEESEQTSKKQENDSTTENKSQKALQKCPHEDDTEAEEEKSGFEKLERSLKLLNSGEDPSDVEMEKETKKPVNDDPTNSKLANKPEDDVTFESFTESNRNPFEPDSKSPSIPIKTEKSDTDVEQRNLSECFSDKENSDAVPETSNSFEMSSCGTSLDKLSSTPDDLAMRHASLERCSFDSDEEIDQVDLIHTVLENRKKPLPAAVRRGTELAWKLLNDPVNPVTSLPIPVVTSTSSSQSVPKERTRPGSPTLLSASPCPVPRARPASPGQPLSTPHPYPYSGGNQTTPTPARPLFGPTSSPPALLRNGMRQHSPAYRELHPYQQHSHYQAPPPAALHRNSHPIFPPPHHYGPHPGMPPSSGSSPIKPSLPSSSGMPIPLPPTPMAFIPPTNRNERIPDQSLSPGTTGEPGVNSHAKPQLPASVQQKSELYECTYCDLTFRDCVMYTVHMGYHSNRNPFKCNSCGIICRDKVEFFLHIARSPHA